MSGAPPTVRLPHPDGDRGRGRDRRSARRGVPVGAVVVALLVGAVAAGTLFADRLGLDDQTPFVQLVAFRPQIAGALLVLALLCATGRRRGVAGALALTLGVVAVLGLATVAPRALVDVGAGTDPAGTAGTAGLTVLTLNVYRGEADPEAVATLVRDRAPDLVALPEAGTDLRRRLSARLDDDAGGSGYRSFVAEGGGDGSSTTVYVRRTLGRPSVAEDRRGTFPTLVVDLPGRPRFVAVHPQAPKPGATEAWRREVADLARWCTPDRPAVLAGDMNATLDHAAFRTATASCTDAAASTGDGLVGTWPSGLPRLLGPQIDHVLLAGGPTARSAEVVDVPGTDHRALIVTLAP